MPFFKDLKDFRRRSKIGHRAETSSLSSTSTTVPTPKSSSTLSLFYGASTPSSSVPTQSSSGNLPASATVPPPPPPPPPPRPGMPPQGNRPSVMGSTGPSSNGSSRSTTSASPYTPRLISVVDNSWVRAPGTARVGHPSQDVGRPARTIGLTPVKVHQKVLLIYGQIGDPAQHAIDGAVTVAHHQDSFPPTTWPVCDSHFKALVHLVPGPNRLRFDFTSPKLHVAGSSSPAHSSSFTVNHLPLVSSPPLELAILVARDSPMTFDAVPQRVRREGNGLDVAIRKYRMAAYLWQAFTGEQMYRQRLGRRCFRFDEEWQTGSLSLRDLEPGQMRNEAKVHIVRTDKTVDEIRDLEMAQQNERASRQGALFGVAMDAVRSHFKPRPNQKRYVAVLILDSHWDKAAGVIRGHAALGGGAADVRLAIFGSHALQSYPSSIEEVVPAFGDCTRTDTDHVANDCDDCGSSWEAANIGIGAHMHEVGHLLGCPHQESGVMLRDYVRLNRTFTCREPHSTRTRASGLRLCLPKDECGWHRLDCLRFRYHPCFRLPSDPPPPPPSLDESVQVWSVGGGSVVATAAAGIAFVELYADEDLCRSHLEFTETNGVGGPPRQVVLAEAELRARLPDDRRGRRLRLEVHSAGQGKLAIDDISALTSKASSLKLSNGQVGFRSGKLGFSQMEGSRPRELILDSAVIPTKLLTQVKVYHGFALDGLEFVYEDFTSQLFGTRGGKAGGSEYNLDTRRGETILGFYLRAGVWIDGIQILTSLGRRSEVFGNSLGGSGHTLVPPRGYSIVGVSGSCGQWIDGFSLIIAR